VNFCDQETRIENSKRTTRKFDQRDVKRGLVVRPIQTSDRRSKTAASRIKATARLKDPRRRQV